MTHYARVGENGGKGKMQTTVVDRRNVESSRVRGGRCSWSGLTTRRGRGTGEVGQRRYVSGGWRVQRLQWRATADKRGKVKRRRESIDVASSARRRKREGKRRATRAGCAYDISVLDKSGREEGEREGGQGVEEAGKRRRLSVARVRFGCGVDCCCLSAHIDPGATRPYSAGT